MARSYGQFQRIEVGFGLDNFSKPIAYSGKEAWVRQVIQLCLYEPGSIPSNPTIGIGMNRYDFLLEDDRDKLQNEINRQVPIFFPDMPFDKCIVLPTDDEDGNIIYLVITLTTRGEDNTVVVAVRKGYNYIDFAIAI